MPKVINWYIEWKFLTKTRKMDLHLNLNPRLEQFWWRTEKTVLIKFRFGYFSWIFIGNCVCIGSFVCLHDDLMMILSNTLIFISHMKLLRLLLFLLIHPHYFNDHEKLIPTPTRSFLFTVRFFTTFHTHKQLYLLYLSWRQEVFFYFGVINWK